MAWTRSPWTIRLGLAVAVFALGGIVWALYIARTEGWSGVWRVKRQFIEKAAPGSAPIVDEGERALRREFGD